MYQKLNTARQEKKIDRLINQLSKAKSITGFCSINFNTDFEIIECEMKQSCLLIIQADTRYVISVLANISNSDKIKFIGDSKIILQKYDSFGGFITYFLQLTY